MATPLTRPPAAAAALIRPMWSRPFLLSAVAATLLLLALFAVLQLRALADVRRQVEHGHALTTALDDVRIAVSEAESVERGYLITGDTAFVHQYRRARATVERRAALAARLTEADPSQHARVDTLWRTVSRRFVLLDSGLTLGELGRRDDAIALVRTGQGRVLMDSARAVSDRLVTIEQRRLRARGEQLRVETQRAWALAGGLLAGTLLLMLLALEGARRQRRRDREAQRALAESEARFRGIFDTAAAGIGIVDDDGLIVDANPALARMLGLEVDELRGRRARTMLPTLADSKADERTKSLRLAAMLNTTVTQRYVRADGEARWTEMTLSRIPLDETSGGLLGVLIDVTDRHRAEAALRESEERFRNVLERVHALAAIIDADGVVTYGNPHLLEVTGWTREEVVGHPYYDRFVADDSPGADPTGFAERLRTGTLRTRVVAQMVTKRGTRRTVSWDAVSLRDADGAVVGAAAIGHDVTEERRLQAMKDQLISTVSHELRNPLTGITGGLRLLDRSGCVPAGRSREALEMATRNAKRMLRLVNDLLDVERLESGATVMELTAVSAEELATRAIDEVRPVAESAEVKLTLVRGEGGAKALACADADRIDQVLVNLLDNAVKFSPRGGEVTLWEGVPRDGVVRLEVRDRGRGIPPDRLDTVFERFVQVEAADAREKKGTGLGLAICRAIVEQHGGKIWAESEFGAGSTFVVELPAA